MIYYTTEIVQTLISTTSFTIGSGGVIDVARPLRINSAFVRLTTATTGTIDYQVAILNLENYEQIGLKSLNGPWARALYYKPNYPLGTIYLWPLPSSGEMHIFADTVLTTFATVQDTISLPPGYNMALMWNLAALLMPSYGKDDAPIINMINRYAAQSKAVIKRTNAHPPQTANYDPMLYTGRAKDAGWILNGGF